MKKIKILSSTIIISFYFLLNAFAQSNDIKISIVMPDHDAQNASPYQNNWISLNSDGAHFHVLITNTSSE